MILETENRKRKSNQIINVLSVLACPDMPFALYFLLRVGGGVRDVVGLVWFGQQGKRKGCTQKYVHRRIKISQLTVQHH